MVRSLSNRHQGNFRNELLFLRSKCVCSWTKLSVLLRSKTADFIGLLVRDGGKLACKPPVMGQMFKINAVIFIPADSLQRGIDLSWVYSFIVGLTVKCSA